jgi:anti-sigma regulatory factor (Ser/Thr protein kinase)
VEVTRAALAVDVEHEADIGAARRSASAIAIEAGLTEERSSDVALITTELATNIVRHGKHGGVLVSLVSDGVKNGVSLVAWDRGPGMNVDACIPDGVSSRGTRGAGLGAVIRIASRWDAYSQPGAGTVVTASVFANGAPKSTFASGGICVPCPGERVAGDGWDAKEVGDSALVVACDGLGHGPGAHDASSAVIAAFRASSSTSPAVLVDTAHGAARATRGAAGTVARIDLATRTLTIAGVGNVAAWLVDGERTKQLVTQHGTLGQVAPKLREESYPFPPHALLVMCSDGLKSRWNLEPYPGLAQRHPSTIAAVLWRDLARGRDDATAVVVREAT